MCLSRFFAEPGGASVLSDEKRESTSRLILNFFFFFPLPVAAGGGDGVGFPLGDLSVLGFGSDAFLCFLFYYYL